MSAYQLSDQQKDVIRNKYIEKFRAGDSTERKNIINEIQEALLPSKDAQDQTAFSKEISDALVSSEGVSLPSNTKEAKEVGNLANVTQLGLLIDFA